LENWRGKNDEVSRRVWEAVETSAGEVRVGEAKRRRGKRRGREKERRIGEEENEKGKDNGGEESSRGMGNIGGRRRSGKEVGARKIP